MSRLALLLAIPLAACAAEDPTDDTLLDTWTDGELALTFADDGTFTNGAESGTWETADGRLRMRKTGGGTVDQAYFCDGELLLLGPLSTDDVGEDAVATWTGFEILDGARKDTVLTLGTYGDALLVETRDGQEWRYEGEWTQEDLRVTAVLEVNGGTMSYSGTLTRGLFAPVVYRIDYSAD